MRSASLSRTSERLTRAGLAHAPVRLPGGAAPLALDKKRRIAAKAAQLEQLGAAAVGFGPPSRARSSSARSCTCGNFNTSASAEGGGAGVSGLRLSAP